MGPESIYNHLQHFQKLVFPPFLVVILNFCVKPKTRLSQKLCEIERFRPNFWHGGCKLSNMYIFQKIILPPFLVAILNFCVKCQNALSSEMVRDRAISAEFWARPYVQSYAPFFPKKKKKKKNNHANTIFEGHLKFKCKNMYMSETVRDGTIWTESFTQHICRVICNAEKKHIYHKQQDPIIWAIKHYCSLGCFVLALQKHFFLLQSNIKVYICNTIINICENGSKL